MGHSRVVLDTSAYSRFRMGHGGLLEAMAMADTVYLPATVLGELEAGFLLGNRYRENARMLDEFLAEPFVEALSVTPDVSRRYGRVFQQLRRAGTPIPVNDIWIAASAIDCGAHLLTFDSDFGRVAELDCTIFEP